MTPAPPPPAPGHGHFPGVSRCAQAWAVGQHHPAGPPEPGRGGGLLGSTSPSQGGEVQRRRGALLPRWALLVHLACGPTTGRAARPPITSPRSPALLVTPAAFLSAPHLCVTLGTGPGPRYWKEGRGEESGDLHPKEGGQGLLEGAPRGPPSVPVAETPEPGFRAVRRVGTAPCGRPPDLRSPAPCLSHRRAPGGGRGGQGPAGGGTAEAGGGVPGQRGGGRPGAAVAPGG